MEGEKGRKVLLPHRLQPPLPPIPCAMTSNSWAPLLTQSQMALLRCDKHQHAVRKGLPYKAIVLKRSRDPDYTEGSDEKTRVLKNNEKKVARLLTQTKTAWREKISVSEEEASMPKYSEPTRAREDLACCPHLSVGPRALPTWRPPQSPIWRARR